MTQKREAEADDKPPGSVSDQPAPVEEGAAVLESPADMSSLPTGEPGTESEAEQLRRRVTELEDRLLRTAADFDNYRKRQARQYDEMVRAASDRVLADLLDVVDNFRRALSHAENAGDGEGYRRGIEMIYEQMIGVLTRNDVETIDSLGKPFDPNLHDALMRSPSDEYPEGTVAIEVSPGYRRGDRILRHARVGVSTGKPTDDEKSNE